MDSEFLSPSEIRELTGCAYRGPQADKLAELGIPHRNETVRVLVSRAHIRAWLSGETLKQSAGPRLDLVK